MRMLPEMLPPLSAPIRLSGRLAPGLKMGFQHHHNRCVFSEDIYDALIPRSARADAILGITSEVQRHMLGYDMHDAAKEKNANKL